MTRTDICGKLKLMTTVWNRRLQLQGQMFGEGEEKEENKRKRSRRRRREEVNEKELET